MKAQTILSKTELQQLHSFLESFKRYCEDVSGFAFPKYNALNISAKENYKPKEAHEEAIWVLAKEIVSQMKAGAMSRDV
jgi:hypothetical protein